MRLAILCFAGGIFCLQQLAFLPSLEHLLSLAGFGLIFVLVSKIRSNLRWLMLFGAFLLGFVWAGGMAQQRLAETLASADEGRDIQVLGIVSEMPQQFENGVRFRFLVEQADAAIPKHIALTWYRGWRQAVDEPAEPAFDAMRPVHAGERWQFTVRLKRPHGNLNPEGFDFEAWQLENGIRAVGYVRPKAERRRLEAFVPQFGLFLERFREQVRERFLQQLPEHPYVGVLIALSIGDQHWIEPAQWLLFSRTGITHLVSISGLHVTLFASLAYGLLNVLWRRSARLMLWIPAQKAAILGGFIAAYAYVLMAGFAIPAQRTLYMLGVAAWALWTQRKVSPSHVLLLALFLVLLLDPWAVLAAGFWLSFAAVAVLFYIGSGRLKNVHWLSNWGRAQWALTLGLIPLLLLLFQQFSLISPLTNALAIPLISFLITPLTLVAALLPIFNFLLEPAHWLTAELMHWMQWFAQWPWVIWQQATPPLWACLLGLVGCLYLILPRGFPARWLGWLALCPLLFLPPVRPEIGEAWIMVLDVGQGLAVHVQTAHHDLLYDTGPRFTSEANSGNRIILPYLRAKGVSSLDGLIVSHQDHDHAGGAEAVLTALPQTWLISSLPQAHPLRSLAKQKSTCVAGQGWEWEGVRFDILHPTDAHYAEGGKKTNHLSCVLKVHTAHGSVLIPADIEMAAEQALLTRYAGGQRAVLHADVLIAPHHGSRTSSSSEFIAAVGAKNVIFPVGYRNHFAHPRADVVERYRRTGAELYRTDLEGAIGIHLSTHGVALTRERSLRPRYWHGQ